MTWQGLAGRELRGRLLHPGSLPRAVCTSHTVGSASHRISKMSRVGCGRWFIFRKRQVILLGTNTKFSSAVCSIRNGKIKDTRRSLADIACGTWWKKPQKTWSGSFLCTESECLNALISFWPSFLNNKARDTSVLPVPVEKACGSVSLEHDPLGLL